MYSMQYESEYDQMDIWVYVERKKRRQVEIFQLITTKTTVPSVLWHCWLGGRKGIWPVKKWGDGGGGHWLVRMEWRSRMVGVSASVNLHLHHKVQKFSSGTGSPGWSGKGVIKRLWYGGNQFGN